MQGITGKLSGKMGSAVFRVREGQQIVAQYNPIVKNPNTAGQQSQRAKFKLMSQLAAVLAPGIGTMGVTKRASSGAGTKRNGFMQKNIALVVTEDTQTGIVAKIPMEQVQLTDSFRPFGSVTATPGVGTITLQLVAADDKTKSGRIALVGYGSMGVQKCPILVSDVTFDFDQHGEAPVTIEDLPVGEYTALVYGYQPSEEVMAKTSLDNIHTPTAGGWIAQINLEQALADGSVAVTTTVGVNVSVTQ